MGRKRTTTPPGEKPAPISAKITDERVIRALERLMHEQPGQDFADFVRLAVLEKLKELRYWPPPPN